MGNLILSRKLSEKIIIGHVTLTVVEILGDRVKLGFVGPRDVPIDREEIHMRKLHGTDGRNGSVPRVLFVNDTAWMWELTAGSSIHGIGPCRFTVDEYADADECKAAAVEYTRRYFAEMLASVR